MTKKDIAKKYISHLQKGKTEQIIALFHKDGMVDSPLYGLKSASEFFKDLSEDTISSELSIQGVFEDEESNSIALYFNYKWILTNKKAVNFDVVDIIEFDQQSKILKLKIIYDTVNSRKYKS
jgi:hypothetical protein